MSKVCISCTEQKPLAEFYRHPRMADGRLNKCVSCCRAYQKGRPDKHVKSAERREHAKRNSAKFRRENPEKYRAQTAVNNAIRDGKLERQPCEQCGAPAHAHHDDYNKPLDVRWLCPKHHGKHHAESREQ